jgi:acetyltransferase-like isoleucine patch superfamily enzyme
MLIEKPRIPVREVVLFGLFPSFLKIWIYRLRGYRIGRGVSIGFGSVICADQVEIGDETRIGFLTIIRGKQVRLGSGVQIGATTFIDTPYLEIGDGTKINEQVFVGGLQFADSKLVMGRNCQIMQMSFINPARSITIGDDTGIGGHCLIFGHTSWLSQFEGYPVDFQPIEIGSSVSVAWRVFILPGTKIGDGAVVGANSLVSHTVPPRCLSMGFPARVVAKAPTFPRDLDDEERIGILRNIVNEMKAYFSQSGMEAEQRGIDHFFTHAERRWFSVRKKTYGLRVLYGEPSGTDIPSSRDGVDVFLCLGMVPAEQREQLQRNRIMWVEIARKERSSYSNDLGDEVLLFLKRYGVRTVRA